MAIIEGGDKFAPFLKELAKNLESGASLKVGFLENAKYPDGTQVAMVAAIQEYGAPRAGIPPRPFFRKLIAEKGPEWPKAIADLLKANDFDAEKVLNIAGEAIKGQLQQSIIDVVAPPLSPVTLMLRKMKADNPDLIITGKTVGEAAAKVAAGESSVGVSTKPLIDTGILLDSVAYEVNKIS